MGAVTLGKLPGSLTSEGRTVQEPVKSNAKQLYATTDFSDNIIINHRGNRYDTPAVRSDEYYTRHKCFMDRAQLDGLHKYLASVGVTRHQWIVDTLWTLYENYPQGIDLLGEAVKSAHAHGLEFYGEIKPFEGGCFGIVLPHTMPCPAGTGAIKDLRGIFPSMRRFAAANPTLCLKRRPGSHECTEPVSAIRLVKSDNRPTRLKGDHFSIWTSASNNRFVKYEGPVFFRETIEKRYRFPYWRQCRILHLEGLEIPTGHTCFLIRCSLADKDGDFSNEKGNLVELVSAGEKTLPLTMSTGQVHLDDHYESFYKSGLLQQTVAYLQHPEVQSEINDRQKMEAHYRDFYSFGEYNITDTITLDKEGYVAVACGKPEYIPGHMHPIYPEVREHWLDMVRYCLDRGVDGINIRTSNHTLSPERWEYGFNEPVIKASKGNTDFTTLSKINGDAYTLFLREARDLVKSRGKKLTVHLETELIIPDDRPGKTNSYPYNFEWQWETWVQEIADELEIRGIYQLRPWNFNRAVDVFSNAARVAGKPICLQGDFHGMSFNGPFASTEAEIGLVREHSVLNGYVFYETANITRVTETGEVEGSTEIAEILKKLKT